MINPSNQKTTYKILFVVFGIAGVVWILYGVFTPRFLLYPFIGLLNLGIAAYCRLMSK
ncbi:MAG: hypothetical protein HZA90_25910 [Verrucomicrobia bacterium]|nr:hypothetical protein [Verrucomicrobiota bacterium]